MKKFIIWLFRIKSADLCGSNYCDREHHLKLRIAQLESNPVPVIKKTHRYNHGFHRDWNLPVSIHTLVCVIDGKQYASDWRYDRTQPNVNRLKANHKSAFANEIIGPLIDAGFVAEFMRDDFAK